jgi:DNA-binding transcriptional LysR family regulator
MKSAEIAWDDLRIVVLAAQFGSLSSVARQLGLSVATVSRRLERLEEALGLRLFQRHSGGLTPTSEARALIERANAVAEKVEDFARTARGAGGEEGVVTVSTLETVITHLIAPRLSELRRKHPRIDLVLRSTPRIVRLDQRKADIAIRVVRPHEARVIGRRIGTLRFGLYATPSYLERHALRSVEDLRGHDVVMYDATWDSVPEMSWLIERMGETAPAFRVTTANAIAEIICGGAAIGLLPTFLANEELVQLAGPKGLPERDLWLVFHEDLRRASHVRAVTEFLTRITREALGET